MQLYNAIVRQRQYAVICVWADSVDDAAKEANRYAIWLESRGELAFELEPDQPEVTEIDLNEDDGFVDDRNDPSYMAFNRAIPADWKPGG